MVTSYSNLQDCLLGSLIEYEVSAGGVGNNAYIFFLGMLMAQFTLTGYDA